MVPLKKLIELEQSFKTILLQLLPNLGVGAHNFLKKWTDFFMAYGIQAGTLTVLSPMLPILNPRGSFLQQLLRQNAISWWSISEATKEEF